MTLQVIVAPEGRSWVAQGLEIDYAAAGDTERQARLAFLAGLGATAQAHLERNGNLAELNTPAAPETWVPLVTAQAGARVRIERETMDLRVHGLNQDTVAFIILDSQAPPRPRWKPGRGGTTVH